MTIAGATIKRALLAFAALAMAATPTAHADELSQAATAQAAAMVECMKAFDHECVIRSMYTRPFEKKGVDVSKGGRALAELYTNLKSIGAGYSRFDLTDPGTVFTGDGLTYCLIPYAAVLEAEGHRLLTEAFFVAASDDDGKTWKFSDGIDATPKSIKLIIPSWSGKALPPRRMQPLTD